MNDRARPGDRWQEGFWLAVDRAEVAVQRCVAGHYQLPGGPACYACGGETAWVAIGGGATVWSWSEFHHRYFDDFLDPPYVVVLVQLDEGPRMYIAPDPSVEWVPNVGARVRIAVGDYAGRRVPLASPSFDTEVAA